MSSATYISPQIVNSYYHGQINMIKKTVSQKRLSTMLKLSQSVHIKFYSSVSKSQFSERDVTLLNFSQALYILVS